MQEAVDDDTDAETLTDVVERVKSSYRAAAELEVAGAKEAVRRSEMESLNLRMHIERRARTVGNTISWVAAGLVALSLLMGTVVSVVAAVHGSWPGPAAVVLTVVPLGLVGLFGLLWGFHVARWRRTLEDLIVRWLQGWMAGLR